MSSYPKWYYDELRQVGVDYASMDEVLAYDKHMQRIRNIKGEIKKIISDINLSKEQTILEIGTGTGELAIEFSRHCKKVYAIDVSKMMLEFAKEKAKKEKRDNIEFYQAGFLTYEHRGEALDAVISQIALHHLPDFWKMIALRRVYKILKKGGLFYLKDAVFPSDIEDYNSFFQGVMDKIKKKDKRLSVQTETHIRDEYSTLDWIMEGLITKAGFKIVKKSYEKEITAMTYVCSKE